MAAAYRPTGWLASLGLRGRRTSVGAPGARPPRRRPASLPDREQRLEVVLGEDLEGDHRVGALDPLELGEAARDQRRELVGLAYAHDGDEVPLARHGVGLGDAFDAGERPAERRHRRALGLDQDDRVGHAECVSPGARMTTFALVWDSTSDLNASASVSIGGNVSEWSGGTGAGSMNSTAVTASMRSIV